MRELTEAESGVDVVWRAFELRPEFVPALDPAGEYLQRVWTNSVYPLAERLGMNMKLPPVQPRSRLAHEAARWALARGRFDAYNAEIFRAFFERGEDIGDADVLVALAGGLSLDADGLRASLKRREHESAVLADERDAEMLGVSGVPAFVADRRAALTGVQSVENLRRMIERVRA